MRAAILEETATPLSLVDDVEIAAPRAGEVRVRVAACGICHSDLTYVEAGLGLPLPIVLGHEAAGVVEEVGPGVSRLSPGDRVMLTPLAACGSCYWCLRGQAGLCADAQQFMTGLLPDGSSPLSRKGETVYRGFGVGGFGEQVVTPESGAVRIPEDTPLDVACVIGCAVQTGVGAVLNTARVEAGATVLVTGLGGIGLSIVQGARVAGAARILASDPLAARRDAAANLGATDLLDPAQDDVVARTRELTGGIGVDYAFEAAGSTKLVEHCVAASRAGGTTVMVGAPGGLDPISLPLAALFITQEKRLVGSLLGSCHSHRDVPRLLSLWRAGHLDLEALVDLGERAAPGDEGLEDLRAGRGIRTVLTA